MSDRFDKDDAKVFGQMSGILGVCLMDQAVTVNRASDSASAFLLGLGAIFVAIKESVDQIVKLDDQDEANADH